MRNIFELTKREQRIVILIVVVLVVFAFAKHFWQNKSSVAPVKSALHTGGVAISSRADRSIG